MSDQEIYTQYEAELEAYYNYQRVKSGDGNKGVHISPKKVRTAREAWVEESQKLLAMLDGRRTQLIDVIRRVKGVKRS